MPGYPYALAFLNLLLIGLGLGAVLDSIDTALRHQMSGSFALLATGVAQWIYTRRSGHPVWVAAKDWAGGTMRGRLTTMSAVIDGLLVVGLFAIG